MDQKEILTTIGLAIGAVIVGIGRAFNVRRANKTNDKLAGRYCEYGEANRERIADLHAEIRVLEAKCEETRRQLDEVFVRIRSTESSINQLIGYLKDRL